MRMKENYDRKLEDTKMVLEGLQERIKKNYYKPIKTKTAFDNDCIEYKETKIKIFHLKIILI